MNSYELSRKWFDWCFDNASKIKPIHSALFFFIIEHNNRLGWKKEFGLPRDMAMDAIGVKNNRTYSSAFNDLEEWNFITIVERSKNQYSANIISLSACVKNTPATTSALDEAMLKHLHKQRISIAPIDKHNNIITSKPTTSDDDLIDTTEDLKQIDVVYSQFVQEVKDGLHQQWAEATYMRLKIKKGSLKSLLVEFKNQLIIDSKIHANTKKLKDHLNNWLNKQEQIGKLEKYKIVSSKSLSI